MNKRVGAIEEFEFLPLSSGKHLHVTIAVTGWLCTGKYSEFSIEHVHCCLDSEVKIQFIINVSRLISGSVVQSGSVWRAVLSEVGISLLIRPGLYSGLIMGWTRRCRGSGSPQIHGALRCSMSVFIVEIFYYSYFFI